MHAEPDRRVHPAGLATVPAGTYRVGSTFSDDEQPVSLVRLSAYAIDIAAVTNRQFAQFMEDGGYHRPEFWTSAGYAFVRERSFDRPSCWGHGVWGELDMPVTGVSWWEARAYATWRHCDLPSEAQWEAACRGTGNGLYPWGDIAPSLTIANYSPGTLTKTGSRRPTAWNAFPTNISAFGCAQMGGNLAEWCLDNYDIEYHMTSGQLDPCWLPDELDEHVTRGGSSIHSEEFMRCAARDPYPPGLRDNFLGFRCVATQKVD